jgi:hypothetical protein
VIDAGEKTRALVASLGSLEGKVRPEALVGALAPLFEPLTLLLAAAASAGPSEGD